MSDINYVGSFNLYLCQALCRAHQPNVPILINNCLLGQELQRLRLVKTFVRCKRQRPQGSLPPDTYTF